MIRYLTQLTRVSCSYVKCHFPSLSQALIKMYGEWDDLSFNFVPYKDTGVKILSAVEDIQVS